MIILRIIFSRISYCHWHGHWHCHCLCLAFALCARSDLLYVSQHSDKKSVEGMIRIYTREAHDFRWNSWTKKWIVKSCIMPNSNRNNSNRSDWLMYRYKFSIMGVHLTFSDVFILVRWCAVSEDDYKFTV